MSCSGRYAQAWEFNSFWCASSLLQRVDDSAGAGNASLEDSQTDFIAAGVRAGVGMVLYNLTDGSSGPVIAIPDEHTLTATLAGGTANLWDDGDEYRIVPITAQEIAAINHYLDIAASDVHSALAASGQCDCTLASWASEYLKKLNIIDAALYFSCSCQSPSLSEEAKQRFLDWMSAQLELIRMDKVDVCGGTGAEFPALDWAEQSSTEFAAAQIIFNDRNR